MFQGLEIVLIIAIIAIQGYFFRTTFQKIKLLQSVFSEPSSHKITKLNLLKSDLENVAPLQILTNLPKYEIKDAGAINPEEIVSLGLLMPQNINPVASAIHHSINTYLLRNSGSAPDFNLIKDIAERNSDAVEEEIGSTIAVPLYLGLLGTLLGIIFGLFNISDLSFSGSGTSSNAMLDLAIPTLLSGVRIAMIASFTGLLLTIIHTGFLFKQAKAANVRNKNDFFTFVQVELLPILNQNLNSTLHSLQANLLTFNKDFSHNILRLDGLMNKNYDALVAQEHVMEMLGKMDITKFATANVQVLTQLQEAIKNFGEFNSYVAGINTAIQKTDNVIAHITGLLQRTEGVETVTQKVLSVFEMNYELMRFLKSHFSALDNSKKMIADSVVEVNEQLTGALDELKKFTIDKITSIQRIEIEHVDMMRKTYPNGVRNADESKDMAELFRRLTESGSVTAAQMAMFNNTLHQVHDAIVHLDENIKVQVKVPSVKQVITSWFKKETPANEKH